MGWKKYTIGELCTKVTDGSHFSPKGLESGFPMASSKDMEENDFSFSDMKYISEADFRALVKADCKPLQGDVLIIKDGNNYTKEIFAVKEERELVVLSSIAILRPKKEIIDPVFLQYALRSPKTRSMMKNYVSGAAIPRIILDDFKKMVLTVPPLPTQQKIASILSTYDDLIENNQQRIAILEQMAQKLYQEWFVRFRFPGYEQVEFEDGLPKGWEKVKVEDLYNTSSGGTPSRKNAEYYKDGTINWVKTKELNDSFIFQTEEKITEAGLKNSSAKIFPNNTVLIALYGATIGQLGILTQKSATNQACCALIEKIPKFTGFYVFLYLTTIRKYLINLGQGAAQQNISQELVRGLEILKPTNEIMEKFDGFISPIFQLIKVLKKKNEILNAEKEHLLPRLLSGRLDLQIKPQEQENKQ